MAMMTMMMTNYNHKNSLWLVTSQCWLAHDEADDWPRREAHSVDTWMRRSIDKNAKSSPFCITFRFMFFWFFLVRLKKKLLAHYESIIQLPMPEMRRHISQKMVETVGDRKRRDCGVDILWQASLSPDGKTTRKNPFIWRSQQMTKDNPVISWHLRGVWCSDIYQIMVGGFPKQRQ